VNFPVPTEDEEQINFVQYLELRNLKFTAIPNHTYNPHRSQQLKNYRLGLRKGLCDMLVVLPGIGLVFVEMKRVKKSVTSSEQRSWIEALNTCPGVAAHVAKGCDEAISIIESYSPSLRAVNSSEIF
jgi:hypothetical protein